MNFTEGCGICGEELVYGQKTVDTKCIYCLQSVQSVVQCPNGHFICDSCHSSSATELIEKHCGSSKNTDPIKLAIALMKNKVVKMHGPEHHFLVPAVLLASYYNSREEYELKKHKLAIARIRSQAVPGGFCGTHGNCGAGVGAGIFISIITGSTPLAEKEWKLSNTITGKTLLKIAEEGGPRCCKRDSFIAISECIEYLKSEFDHSLPQSTYIVRSYPLYKITCFRSFHPNLSHV